MKHGIFWSLVASTLTAGGALFGQDAPSAAAPKKADVVVGRSQFYPLELGTEWQYEGQGRTITVRVTKHENIDGRGAAKVDSYMNEKLIASEHITVTKDGVYRASFGGDVPTKPVMILKLPPKDGEGWDVETAIAGTKIRGTAGCRSEKLELPAGKFDAYRVSGQYILTTADGTETEAAFQFWFAEGTGIVKMATATPNGEVVMKLKSFQRGK